LDLEGLARHRGSLFGAWQGRPQPTQALFESGLYTALEALDPARPVVVEAESSRIGARTVPPALWRAMGRASVIELSAPVAARAAFSAHAYADIGADPDAVEAVLGRLPPHHSRDTISAWKALARSRETEALAAALIAEHYDPAYRRQSARRERPLLGRVAMSAVTPADLDQAAESVRALIGA
jgi:tRNA 2-selenouridine synthase